MTAESEMNEQGPVRPVIDDETLDRLMDQIDSEGLELLGPEGVLTELTSRIMNRALETEMTHHLGYEKGDPTGWGSGNNRNGHYSKNVLTDAGGIPIEVPRDRDSSFDPVLVPNGKRRLSGFNDLVVGLVARGMTTRDVRDHVADVYQVDISAELVSKITDAIIPELFEWQNRPLDPVYPILYLDAIVVKVRTDGRVRNRPVYIALAVDLDGRKQVLGLWLGSGDEGSKFWLRVLTELKNRGVSDVLIVCCDGLKGLPDAIEATWPQAVVQTCVIHLLRGSFRYAAWNTRKKVAAALRPIYTAPTVEAAEKALADFENGLGKDYPAIVKLWKDAWETFIPFLAFPTEIRKVVYTTNMIESVNYQLRKVTKNRGHFPTERAAVKLLYLAIRNITNERRGETGTGTVGWTACLNQLAVYFPGRLNVV